MMHILIAAVLTVALLTLVGIIEMYPIVGVVLISVTAVIGIFYAFWGLLVTLEMFKEVEYKRTVKLIESLERAGQTKEAAKMRSKL